MLMNRTKTAVLEEFGVSAAIADFISQLLDRPNTPKIMYRCDPHFRRLTPALENTMYRIAQECIANACKHSGTKQIQVTLSHNEREAILEVRDWGSGFDMSTVSEERFGLAGIRERARLFGSQLAIESTPGKGTCIRTTFPLIFAEDQSFRGVL